MIHEDKTERDLDEWDAEIEADFQRAVAAGKRAGQLKRRRKLVAFPWGFFVDVCKLTEGRDALVVAEYIYRRIHVCNNKTVTLPASELAELGITRRRKNKALAKLKTAKVIRIGKAALGRSAKITLTWRPH